MNNFQYISIPYKSNCLIEAVKAKIFSDFNVKIYFCKPRFYNSKFQMCHFMWSDGEYDYDFTDNHEDELPWYKCFLFDGQIRRFKKGFAERYSKYRNRKEIKYESKRN